MVAQDQRLVRAEVENERGEVACRRPPIEGHARGDAVRHRARAAVADRPAVLAKRDALGQQRPAGFLYARATDGVHGTPPLAERPPQLEPDAILADAQVCLACGNQVVDRLTALPERQAELVPVLPFFGERKQTEWSVAPEHGEYELRPCFCEDAGPRSCLTRSG